MSRYIKYKQIIKNFPSGMIKVHKLIYLNNIRTIEQNEALNGNKGLVESLKNSNHLLIRTYLKC